MFADAPMMPALDLRCREAEWIDDAASLSDFDRPAALPPMQRDAGLVELLFADLLARRQLGLESLAGQRPILSCETPRWGIPVGVWDPQAAPAIEQWRLQDQLTGELIHPDADLLVRALDRLAPLRGLIAAASLLPLLLTSTLAHAGPGLSDRVSTVVQAAPPKLPDDPQPQPSPKTETTTTSPAATSPTTTAAPTTTTAPVVEPPAGAPNPVVLVPKGDDSLSLTGQTLWDGLMDQAISLAMKNGQSLDGTVVAQSSSDLALARASDGAVVSVPKAEVAGVRLRAEALNPGGPNLQGVGPIELRPTQDGRGLIGGGIMMLTTGSILALAGTVMLGIYPSGVFINLPLLIPGIVLIGVGAGTLVAGKKRRAAFRQAWGLPEMSKLQLQPTLGLGRSGGQAGLVLRF